MDSGHSALCNMLRYYMGWQSGIDCHLDFFGSIVEQLYSQESIEGEDMTKVTRILDQLGARDYADNSAEQYYCQALARVEATRLDTSRQGALKKTACFLLKRDF